MSRLSGSIVFCIAIAVSGAAQAETETGGMRLILNEATDGMFECVPFDTPLDASSSSDTIVSAYHQLIDFYADTNISQVFFGVNYQRVAYDSDSCESYWDCPDPGKNLTGWPLKSWYVHNAGVDPYQACIRRCREKGISPWITFRMNDTHYRNEQYKMFSLWWEHPEYRTNGSGFQNGLNYALKPVRELFENLIRDAIDRYDVDGIELDWMRFPYFFNSDQQAEGLDILTAFVRDVRELTNECQARRKHPVGIAVRVPATPDMANDLGLDAVRWVQEGLVDVLIPTATWRPTDTDLPLEEWRAQIGEKAPPFVLAAGTDLWYQGVEGGSFMKDTIESQRGFTAAMLHRGADSIYLFNHFNHNDFIHETTGPDGKVSKRDEYHDLLSLAGDAKAALSGPRRHVLTFRDTAIPGRSIPAALPATVDAGHDATLKLYTGPAPQSGTATLRVGLAEADGLWDAVLSARANRMTCTPIDDLNVPGQYTSSNDHRESVSQVAPRVVQFDVPLSAVRPGMNEFEIGPTEGSPQKVIWFEVYVDPGN